jgi:hypothetical protein
MRHRSRTTTIVIAGGIALVLLVLPGLLSFGASWLWMREVGFETVLVRELTTKLALVVGVGLAAYGFLRLNLRIARGGHRPRLVPLDDVGLVDAGPSATAGGAVPGVIPAVAAGLLALAASSGWLAVLKALHGVPFGVSDPMLGRDVAFYAFTLPVLSGALALCVALTLFALLLVGAFYVLSGAVAVSGVTSTARDGSPVLLPPQAAGVARRGQSRRGPGRALPRAGRAAALARRHAGTALLDHGAAGGRELRGRARAAARPPHRRGGRPPRRGRRDRRRRARPDPEVHGRRDRGLRRRLAASRAARTRPRCRSWWWRPPSSRRSSRTWRGTSRRRGAPGASTA